MKIQNVVQTVLVTLAVVLFIGHNVTVSQASQNVVLLIEWHPSGEYLAVALDADPATLSRDDESVWIYTSNGQPITVLPIPATEILDIQWNQDGSRLAVVTEDVSSQLFLWDTTNPQQPVAVSSNPIYPLAVSVVAWNNGLLAIDYAVDEIQIWDTVTNQLLHTFSANLDPDSVNHITWNTEDNLLAIAGAYEVQIWDLNGTPFVAESFTSSGGIRDVEWRTNQLLVAADEFIYIWQATSATPALTYEVITTLTGHTSKVGTVDTDLYRIASVATDGTLRIWDSQTGQQISILTAGTYGLSRKAMALSADGTKLAYADEQAHLKIVQFPVTEPGPNRMVTDIDNSGSEPVTLDGSGSFDPDGTIVAYEWSENGIAFASTASVEREVTLGQHTFTLKVTDNDGLTDSDTVDIEVVPSPYNWLAVAYSCNANDDLVLTISNGDTPFNVTTSNGWALPPPDQWVLGNNIVPGPASWNDLTVSELSGDTQSINLEDVKCRPDAPILLIPPHGTHTTVQRPLFRWSEVPEAHTYRIEIYDVLPDPTFQILESFPAEPNPSYRPSVFLPVGQYFWRMRARVNNAWSLWSPSFTLYIDPPLAPLFGELTSVPIGESLTGEGPTTDGYELTFTGDQLGIVFDTDPDFKEMTIEVDGEVFSTIYPDLPAAEGMIELYTLPDDGEHTVRVYGPDNAAALRAFLIEE